MNKVKSYIPYWIRVSELVELIRFDCFYHCHHISDFIPYSNVNLDYFSIRQDAEEELPAELCPMGDPLTLADCQNYFAGRPLTGNTAIHR